MNADPSTAEPGEGNLLKGLASGAIAGATAAFVMSQVQTKVMPKVQEMMKPDDQQQQEQQSSGGESSEPATVKAAEGVSENLFGHELEKEEKKWAGPLAHYMMGTVSGAIYGVAAEADDRVTLGAGLPFGASVWAIADETIVPALGLSKKPTEYPPGTHAYALASHLIYGFTAEMVRERVRSAL